jgi:crossover junction endodeoxyribonuclease RuvC
MERMEQRDLEFILAIDPALSTTGYAVINLNTLELAYINKFTTSPKNSDDFRINEIVAKLFCIASQYPIKHVVLEDGFLGRNPSTALQLATLRGAIIGVFSFNKYIVHHMLPSQIRKILGCGGNAKKEQVAEEIVKMYPNNKKLDIIGPYSDKQNKDKTSDIYDAISIGVAFAKSKKEGQTNG